MPHVRRKSSAWLCALALSSFAPVMAQSSSFEPTEPMDLGVEEKVEVRLVLIDVVVIDRRGHTIPDLRAEDFDLVVGGSDVEIASLDSHCPLGRARDAVAGARDGLDVETSESVERDPAEPPPRAAPSKIVLVFDYFHMENAAWALDGAIDALRRLHTGHEEHMVVALAESMSILSPFTADLDETLRTLREMRDDPRLYFGQYSRFTEFRFFERAHALLDVMEQVPGRKVIVLYSGPFLEDGFHQDPQFAEIASLSARARTSIYPIDSMGMRTPLDPDHSGTGGPLDLARLAVETGGRMTANTNDLGLPYARAQRDLGCTYTLGFYDRSPRLDKNRRLRVFVRQPRIRVVHPASYVIRSRASQLRSLTETAWIAPEIFQGGGIEADLLAVRPSSARRWDAVIAVAIEPRPDWIDADAEWQISGIIRKPWATLVHSFRRTFRPPRPGEGPLVLLEGVKLKPGDYALSVVLTRPDAETPVATNVDVTLPGIPRDVPFLVGPFLGRRADPSATGAVRVRAEGAEPWSLEPVLSAEASGADPLAAVIRVCRVRDDVGGMRVSRFVRVADGEIVQELGSVSLDLDEGGKIRCDDVSDSLPGGLGPGRYELVARGGRGAAGVIEFSVRD